MSVTPGDGSHLFDPLEHLTALVRRKERILAHQLQAVGEGRRGHGGEAAGRPGGGSRHVEELTGGDHRSGWDRDTRGPSEGATDSRGGEFIMKHRG